MHGDIRQDYILQPKPGILSTYWKEATCLVVTLLLTGTCLLVRSSLSAPPTIYHWLETECYVKQVGVAYRGTCEEHTDDEMLTHIKFRECGDSLKAMYVWSNEDPGTRKRCPVVGPDVHHSRRLMGMHMAHIAPKADTNFGAPLKHHLPFRPMAESCYNSFLPWAVVTTQSRKPVKDFPSLGHVEVWHCAYLLDRIHGSEFEDWPYARRHMDSWNRSLLDGMPTRCWTIAKDDCKLAMGNMRKILPTNIDLDLQSFMLATGSAVFMVCAFVLHTRMSYADLGGVHKPLPTREPESPQFTDRVQKILNAACRFDEASATSSAASTARGAVLLGGEVPHGRPANLAADFLAAADWKRSRNEEQ